MAWMWRIREDESSQRDIHEEQAAADTAEEVWHAARISTRPPRKDRIFIPKFGIAVSGRFRLLGAFKML
jgi:hypothetical protein